MAMDHGNLRKGIPAEKTSQEETEGTQTMRVAKNESLAVCQSIIEIRKKHATKRAKESVVGSEMYATIFIKRKKRGSRATNPTIIHYMSCGSSIPFEVRFRCTAARTKLLKIG